MNSIKLSPAVISLTVPAAIKAEAQGFLPEGVSWEDWALCALREQQLLLIPEGARKMLAACATESQKKSQPIPPEYWRVWGFRPMNDACLGVESAWERMGFNGTAWYPWCPFNPKSNFYPGYPETGPHDLPCFTAGFEFPTQEARQLYAGGSPWYSFNGIRYERRRAPKGVL